MEENIGFDDLKDFSEVLEKEDSKENEVILRKGTENDILPEANPDLAINTISDYTEEEFHKEFGSEQDPDEVFDEDCRIDISSKVEIIEREELKVDDIAGTLSSGLGPNQKYFTLKVKMDKEDPRTIDIDIPEDSQKVYYSFIFMNLQSFTILCYISGNNL